MSVRARVVTHMESNLRTRALASSCAAMLLALVGCSASPDDPRAEFSTDLAIDGTDASHARTMQPGAYLFELRERDVDVRLAIDAPGVHVEVSDEVPRHGVLHGLVTLESAAEVRVVVKSADHSTKHGSVQLRVSRWERAPTAPPGEFERGFAALVAAGELTAHKTPAASERASDKLYEAVTHFEKAHAERERAQAQYTLANLLYLVRNEFPAAIRAADAAADGFDEVDDEIGVQNSSTLRAAAEIELASGMDASKQRSEQTATYDDADRRLAAAAEFFAGHSLPIRAAYAVNMRGVRAMYLGDNAAAAGLFGRAVEMTRANQDLREQAIALANLAWIHNRLGFIAQAATEYEALLPMIERQKEPYQYAVALGNYGFCLIALGDFDRALSLHNEALALYTAQGRQTERAVELAALGGLHFRIGDTARALEILRAAIAAQEKAGDAIGQASSLRVAGNAASSLGQHQEALEYLRKSAQIDSNQTSAARTRVLIAGELRALGDLQGAEAELVAVLGSGNALIHANALEERARLRAAQRRPEAAIADLRAADAEYLKLGLEFNRIDTNTALSRALLASRDLAGATAAADEAVAITARIRVKSANPEWRARFLSARYSPYEARIATELAAGGADATWRSFRTAEDVRARSLADQLALGPRRDSADDKTDGLRAKLTSLQLRLEARSQKQGADDPGTIELRRSIEETRAQLDAGRAAVAVRESALPDSLARVQQSLPPSSAVLAYFVGDYDSHAWLLSRDTLRHRKLPGLTALQKQVVDAVGLQGHGASPRESLRALSDTLLGDMVAGIDATRLLVIPDGPLNGVPFAALPSGNGARELLLDRFVLGYAPSLSLALAAPRDTPRQHARVAVVSDPVYAPDDRRLKLALGPRAGTFRGPRETSANNLTRLPYSALEARAVLKALGGSGTIALEGFDATPPKVLALPAQDLAVLHFATHALARRDSPEQSALYLSEYAADGSFVPDSRITAGEIARSGLRADVVVLSGCATGDGGELRGEGVLGLTYGFLANGSRAVVASLWPVEDASTARFMSEFYGAYRAKPHPAEALRRAQLHTRDVAAATVWSSFVVRANGFP
jgi:CHAT domain-containing protein/tetratricopeptide (TPR) repeat protein